MDTAPARTLRDRQRSRAMRRVQERALDLFAEHGFDAVSVETIAAAAEVSPVSVYRWFGTKERVVLWDEYDPGLLAAVAERLDDRHPLEAVRDAVVAELDRVYDIDRGRVLVRTQLIYAEPALLAATLHDQRALQAALAGLFASAEPRALAQQALAGVAVSVLTTAVDAWQQSGGEQPLSTHVRAAFDVLRGVPWTR